MPSKPNLNKYRWIAFTTLLAAAFMSLLDVTIVNVAIPTLREDLNMSYGAIQWMSAGYTLSFAIFLVAGGRLGDIFGRKKVFIAGVTGFSFFSLMCGLAWSSEVLIVMRLFQGAMAAVMMPQILANLVVLFKSSKERLRASGMYGGIAGLATVSGPVVGGFLIENNILSLEWRSIFLINVPVGILGVYAALRYLPESKSKHPLNIDWIGMGLLGVALFMVLFPLIQGRELDWPLWVFLMMAGSVPLLVLFILYEKYKTKKDGSPLVVLELFKERVFVTGMVLFLSFFGAMTSFFFLFTLFLQIGLGFSALNAGLNNVPLSVGIGISAGVLVNVLLPKIGRNVLVLGALFMMLGYGWIVMTLNWYGADVTSWQMLPGLFVAGIGMGMFIASLFNFVLADIPHNHAGSASGMLSTMQELGSAIGIAVVGVMFFNLLGSGALASASTQEETIRNKLTAAHIPAAAQTPIIDGFKDCFVDRSNAKDPDETPASCKQKQGTPLPKEISGTISSAVKDASLKANEENFVNTFRTTLISLIGLYGVILLLVFFLPKKAPEHMPDDTLVL